MEFKVLGPLEVLDGERMVEITAAKQRALLAVLLVHANQVVSLDRLIDQLWSGEPPPQATAALQAYVSYLRRALEPDRPRRAPCRVLVSKPPGYLLAVEPDRYDAARFGAEVSAGQRLLAEGRPEAARLVLDVALGMWRGPALAEFAHEPFAQAEAVRLEELRAVAFEGRLEAALALGQHAEACSELEWLVTRYRFRESLWGLYVLALYRSGRQADALRAYQQCRTALTEQLGIEPGAPLRGLEDAILNQDPSLDWRRPQPQHPPAVASPPPPPPPPATAVGAPVEPMVGREAELACLKAAWEAAQAGHGRCLLVSGDAGIGKTRLVEELAAWASASGGDVVWGRCQESEDAPAFWPWAQVVPALLAGHPPDAAADALAESGLGLPDLAVLAPTGAEGGSHEPPPLVDPGAARFRLYRSVSTVLSALAGDRPLLVVLDDVHWADEASLQLLQFFAPALRGARILLVATFREHDVADDHPLVETLASLARSTTVERTALSGLSPGDVGHFIALSTAVHPPEAVAASVHKRTGGNPFFVRELVRLLNSESLLADPARAAVARVPAGVRDVIRRRLARLPEQTNALLSIAAVVGHEFDLQVIETVAGLEGDAVLDALEPALLAGIIVEPPERPALCRFAHALLHETLYGGMSGLRRARLHARVAEAITSLDAGGSAVALAHHLWRAGTAGAKERLLPALLRAAEESMGRLAYEQAAEQLSRAIEVLSGLPPSEDRDRQELWAQVRLGMVAATTKGQSSPGAAASFARARELCARVTHPPEQLPALHGLFLVSWFQLDLPAAATYASQLLDVAHRQHDLTFLVAGHLAMGIIAFERGDLPNASRHFELASASADSCSDPWLADVLQGEPSMTSRCFHAFVLALSGEPDVARALADEGVERARQRGHPWSMAVAYVMRAWVAVVLGDTERAAEYAEEAAAYVTERGFELLAATTDSMRGWAAACAGDPIRGMELVESGLARTESTGMRLMKPFHLWLVAEVQRRALGPEAAIVTVDQALAESEASGERFYEAELHRLRGELIAQAYPERAGEAEADLLRAVEAARAQGARSLQARATRDLESLRSSLQAAL